MLIESLESIRRPLPRVGELLPRTDALAQYFATRHGTLTLRADMVEQETLCFEPNSLDAIVSNLSVHCVNDLPGLLAQARRALKPDGLLMITLPGVGTLQELRQVLADAEVQCYGGITPRVAPFLEVRDAGALLQRAGFALPVIDSTSLTVTYPDMFALLRDLRGAGEANMLQGRTRRATTKQFFYDAAARYAQHYAHAEGIVATVEILTLTAWSPASSQQQPARRGSGQTSLRDVL